MKYFEIIGIPGSGKTTLSKRLMGQASGNPHRLCTYEHVALRAMKRCGKVSGLGMLQLLPPRLQKSFLYRLFPLSGSGRAALCRAIANNPELSLELFGHVERNKIDPHHVLLATWFTYLLACYQAGVDHLNEDEFLILDEGFVGRVVTLFGYRDVPVSPETLKSYLSKIPPVHLLIVLDTPVNICLERMAKRGFPARLGNVSDNNRQAILEQCLKCIEQTAVFFKGRGLKVLRIPSENTIEQSVQLIGQSI